MKVTLPKLVQEIIETRAKIKKIQEILDDAKSKRDQLNQTIIDNLKTQQLQSAKTEQATVAIVSRKTLQVINEQKVVQYFKKLKLNDYVAERLSEVAPSYLNEAAKKGIKVDGTELKETEFLSVRQKFPEVKRGGENERR